MSFGFALRPDLPGPPVTKKKLFRAADRFYSIPDTSCKKDSEQARLIGSCNNEFLRLIDCHNGSNLSQVNEYLQVNPFTARQTPENEIAYERLMDVRLKLYVS